MDGSGGAHLRQPRLEPREGSLHHDSHHQAPAGQPGFGVGHRRHDGRGSRARRGPRRAAPSIKYLNGFENASNTSEAQGDLRRDPRRRDEGISCGVGQVVRHAHPPAADVFTRQGGYSSTFPTKGYTTSVDIYLDVTKATGATTCASTGARRSTSPTAPTSRDFIFHVGSYADAPGKFYVNASNNAPGDRGPVSIRS